ncbi:hypothetical protein SDC9_96664 [bioreactor metagenome]|uniref:Uncharacterized protein n=1 Tax=bioreactor metagenome TaxID=1076179 RepID=A0A645A9R4_9ZZZZ
MILIRQLDFEYKNLWEKKNQVLQEMIPNSDCSPTLLSGWTDDDISLWDVSAIDGKPDLREILHALCRNKTNWKKICYIQFSKEAIDLSGLSLTPSNGKTGDQRINISQTHFEIKGITAKGLSTLLFNIYKSSPAIGIYTKNDYDQVLLNLYDNKEIRQIAYSATEQLSQENVMASGSGTNIPLSKSTAESACIETESTFQITKPKSSTK